MDNKAPRSQACILYCTAGKTAGGKKQFEALYRVIGARYYGRYTVPYGRRAHFWFIIRLRWKKLETHYTVPRYVPIRILVSMNYVIISFISYRWNWVRNYNRRNSLCRRNYFFFDSARMLGRYPWIHIRVESEKIKFKVSKSICILPHISDEVDIFPMTTKNLGILLQRIQSDRTLEQFRSTCT